MKIGDILPVTKDKGSNTYTDANGLIWIEIGDPDDPGGVYAKEGVTGTVKGSDDNLTVVVDELDECEPGTVYSSRK